MIDTTYNEIPKLTWGEIITVCGAAVLDAKNNNKITKDEAEKVFDILSAAIHVMRDHKRAAEILKLMKEIGMDYESSINTRLANKMG